MEKLKLKDAIDKFLKEGEYELIDENLIGENAKEIIINMVKDAFKKGAEWMKEEQKKASKILLFKAVKWMKEHASDYAWYDFEEYYPVFDVDRFIYDLKKAMEE